MVENEYSKALFELSDNNKVTLDEFKLFIELLNVDGFKDVLNSPKIATIEKKNIIRNSLKNFSELFINFICVILDNNRFELIDNIYDTYYNLILDNENTIIVDAYSSNKLNDDEVKKITLNISKKLNKKVILNNIVDNSIIGGIKIIYNGLQIDLTVNDKINKIKALV